MSSKLLSSGGYGCVYYPSISCRGHKTSKRSVTKLQVSNESSDNEMAISKIIRDIPMYKNYFIPVISSCPLKLKQLKDDIIEECDVLKNNEDVVLMEMDYVNGMTLGDYLTKNNSIKHIINSLISTYTYLLHSLNILNQHNIVHFDFKGDNIMYNINKNIPLIIDFGLSIDLENVKESNLDFYFFTYSPSYYVWCPEIHFICYLVNIDNKLTREKIKEMCHTIVDNNKDFINILSDSFLDEYTDNMVNYYLQFVDMKKDDIIKKLLQTSHTWDNYSLANIYIRIISRIYPDGFTKNDFIIDFIQLLLNVINPDPNRRYSIHKCLDTFENIVTSNDYNSFADVLDSLKIHRKHFNTEISKRSSTIVNKNEGENEIENEGENESRSRTMTKQ